MKTCFFTGHRIAPESIYPALLEAVERHISQHGVTVFVVGHYGDFDRLAARAVKAAKQNHPNITLLLLLPYHPAERPVESPPGFDNTYYPPGMEKVPRQLAILRANRYMVENTDYLIAYVRHPASNAKNLLEYAQKREKRGLLYVENLG